MSSAVCGVTRYSVYDVSGGLVSIDQKGAAGPTEYIRSSGMTLARVAGAAVTWLHPDHLGSAVAGTGSTRLVGPAWPMLKEKYLFEDTPIGQSTSENYNDLIAR